MKIFGKDESDGSSRGMGMPSPFALEVQSLLIKNLQNNCDSKADALHMTVETMFMAAGCFAAYMTAGEGLKQGDATVMSAILMEKLADDVRSAGKEQQRKERDE